MLTVTSPAAPLVALVIANLLATGDLPSPIDLAPYPPSWRRKSGQDVVWNLVDIAHNPPEPWPAIGNLSL